LTTRAAASAAGIPLIGWIIALVILGAGLLAAAALFNSLGGSFDGKVSESQQARATPIVTPKENAVKTKSEVAMDKISPQTDESSTPNYNYDIPQSSFEPTKISQDDQINLATLIAQKIKEQLFVDMSQVKSTRNVIPVYTKS